VEKVLAFIDSQNEKIATNNAVLEALKPLTPQVVVQSDAEDVPTAAAVSTMTAALFSPDEACYTGAGSRKHQECEAGQTQQKGAAVLAGPSLFKAFTPLMVKSEFSAKQGANKAPDRNAITEEDLTYATGKSDVQLVPPPYVETSIVHMSGIRMQTRPISELHCTCYPTCTGTCENEEEQIAVHLRKVQLCADAVRDEPSAMKSMGRFHVPEETPQVLATLPEFRSTFRKMKDTDATPEVMAGRLERDGEVELASRWRAAYGRLSNAS
jgi:hypothetical protein